jgi:uncharacterized membrane protein
MRLLFFSVSVGAWVALAGAAGCGNERVYHRTETAGGAGADDGAPAGHGALAGTGSTAGNTASGGASSPAAGGDSARGGTAASSGGTAGSAPGPGGSGGSRAASGGSGGDAGSAGTSAGESGASGESGANGCASGFTGAGCGVDIDDCAGVSCGEHGHCVDGVAAYTCACDGGFTGADCELPRLETLTPTFGVSCGNAVSGDGKVVVGYLADNPRSTSHPFRWTEATGALPLMSNTEAVDYGVALGVSADGSVVTGSASLPSGSGVFRWTQSDGVVLVGSDGNAAVSRNGTTIVGRANESDGYHLFRWTQATGAVEVAALGGVGIVAGLSGDGTAAVGEFTDTSASIQRAFLWTAANALEPLGPTNFASSAHAVSGDGRVVVGEHNAEGGGDRVAFRWDRQSGMVDLELGDLTYTAATAITYDGKLIVGTLPHESFLWSEAGGVRLLSELLADKGVDVASYADFQVTGVSDDGTVLTGCVDSGGDSGVQAFIARIGD